MVDAVEISKEAKLSAQPERLWPPQKHDLLRSRLNHGKNGLTFRPHGFSAVAGPPHNSTPKLK